MTALHTYVRMYVNYYLNNYLKNLLIHFSINKINIQNLNVIYDQLR
jgi:hypothetical protein